MPSYFSIELTDVDVTVGLDHPDIVARLREMASPYGLEEFVHDAINDAIHEVLDGLINRGLRIDDVEFAPVSVRARSLPAPPPSIVKSIHSEPF